MAAAMFGRPSIGGVSVADISMDEPSSPMSHTGGENIGDNVVIPQLKEDIESLKNDKADLERKIEDERQAFEGQVRGLEETVLVVRQEKEVEITGLRQEIEQQTKALETMSAENETIKSNLSTKCQEFESLNNIVIPHLQGEIESLKSIQAELEQKFPQVNSFDVCPWTMGTMHPH